MLFFFKQKSAYEMRISDWSSDVCSSDLSQLLKFPYGAHDDFCDFLGHIGNGLTKEIRASRPGAVSDDGKVIRLGSLRTGSPAWIRIMGERRRRDDERQRSLAGW